MSEKIFITGATGYIGSYVVSELLTRSDAELFALTRANSRDDATQKLWRSLQLHMSADVFHTALKRIKFVLGDLTAPRFGLAPERFAELATATDSIVHIAAALNRRSERACMSVNLKGALHVTELALERMRTRRLRRFTHVSTVAVAGERWSETVVEDQSIDWQRRDYDPYARTKKFGEHMVRELLGDTSLCIVRPSIVLGDSRRPETTQFDMARTFTFLADLPLIPLRPEARLDIVPANFVGEAIARLHLKSELQHDTYHLSSGTASPTAQGIAEAVSRAEERRTPTFSRVLERGFAGSIDALALLPAQSRLSKLAWLLKVFLPYIRYDTVFDNQRVCLEIDRQPAPFTSYCVPLYRWVKSVRYKYPYRELSMPVDAKLPSNVIAPDFAAHRATTG